MKTFVFIAVVVVVGLSGGRLPDEKACCLSSKTWEKNVCRGRITGLSTEMARVAEVDGGNFFVMKRESDLKCLYHAHAQSFDRREDLRGFIYRITAIEKEATPRHCTGKPYATTPPPLPPTYSQNI